MDKGDSSFCTATRELHIPAFSIIGINASNSSSHSYHLYIYKHHQKQFFFFLFYPFQELTQDLQPRRKTISFTPEGLLL